MGATERKGLVFHWEKPYGAADGQQCAEVADLILWADEFGHWRVVRKNHGAPGSIIITHEDQSKGENINEAKQRAQAAAIVQLQLTGEFNNQN